MRMREQRSNNTNKLSPQEHDGHPFRPSRVQIIQINLVLKNDKSFNPFSSEFK